MRISRRPTPSATGLAASAALCAVALGAAAATAAAAEWRVALVEEVLPAGVFGARLPEPLVRALAEGFEKSAGAKLLTSTGAPDGAGLGSAAAAPAVMGTYAEALSDYGKEHFADARKSLYTLQDSIETDPRRFLREPRVADALADALLLLADIDLRGGRVDDARAWLESYVRRFPMRDPEPGRYRVELTKRLGEVRSTLRAAGGGSAVVRAPGAGWRVHLNGALVGRGEVRLGWLPEGTYYAYAAEGDRLGAVVDLDVWNGKETRLDLPAPAGEGDARVVRFASVDESARWDDAHASKVAGLAAAASADGALVLRVLSRTWTGDGAWRGGGWTVGAWVYHGGTNLGWSAVTLGDPADEPAMRDAMRRLGAELGAAFRAAAGGKGAGKGAPVETKDKGSKSKKGKKGAKRAADRARRGPAGGIL